MPLIACYLDESADPKRQEVFAVGGLFGHLVNWFELERLWEQRLRVDSLAYFRAADCEAIRGPFEAFRADRKALQRSERLRAENVRTDLIQVIRKNGLVGVGVGMIMRDFNSMIQDKTARKILGADPYHLTYKLAFSRVADALKKKNPLPTVAFICDEDGQNSSHAVQTYQDFKDRNANIEPLLGSLSYMDDRGCPPLQAADLMAFEAMHKARAWLRGDKNAERNQFKKLKGTVFRIDACDRDVLIRLVENNRQYL